MSSSFPEFLTPQPMDGQRIWTAAFESYDQRNDDIYYIVQVRDGGDGILRFIAQIWAGLPDDKWDSPTFVERARNDLAKVAATGQTNTSYIGKMI